MGRIVVSEFVSLDGVMEAPGPAKRLFGETSDPKRWQLDGSQAVGDGVVILVFIPADPAA